MTVTEDHRRHKRAITTDGGPAGEPAPTVEPIAPEYPVRTKDKVAIVGFADGHRGLAPFNDPEFEIWGLNRLHANQEGRWDRWFEIHDLGLYMGEKGEPADQQHLEFLRSFPGPIYLRPQDMGRIQCPTGQPYQIESVLRDFGSYLNNSISYMLAYAIAMRFKEIHLYGVDMAQDQLFSAEYRQQRPSCEFFIGIAIGRGIKVFIPPGSDLLKSDHLYGFSDGTPMMLKRLSRLQELGRRKDKIRQQMNELEAQKTAMDAQYQQRRLELVAAINQMDGAQQQVQYDMVNLTSPPEVEPPQFLAH